MGKELWQMQLQELLHLGSHTPLTHCSPSMRTLKTSLRMVTVEPRTKTEKKRVLMGSAILHWGCRERDLCEAGGGARVTSPRVGPGGLFPQAALGQPSLGTLK